MTVVRIAALVAAALGVYANTFTVPFVFHDRAAIESNLRIRELWPAPFSAAQPVLEWTYALNYALGGLSVFGYHLANLALHIACGLLLYDIVRRSLLLSRTEFARATWVAWWAAMIFLVHPLQTEAVTLVSGRSEVLAACWLLAMLELALLGQAYAQWRVLLWLGAVVTCALGMGTSPTMVVAPLALAWFTHLLFPRPRIAFVAFGGESAPPVSRSTRWPLHVGTVATWGILAWLLVTRMQPGALLNLGISPFEYFRAQLGVTWHYFELLIWPIHQSIDYEWTIGVPLFLPVLGWTLIVALLMWLIAAKRRAAAFWLGFALLALVPTSTFAPLADLVSERRMYLSVAGFAVLTALAGAGLAHRARRTVVLLGAAVLVATLAATASGRNHDWRDPTVLWGDALAAAPNKDRVFRELAASYTRKGDHLRAARVTAAEVFALELAWQRSPNDPAVRIALSRVYGRVGRIAEALVIARGTVGLAPTDPVARATFGALLLGQARPQDALEQLEIAQALVEGQGRWIDPDTARAVCTNLGWAYASVGRSQEALAVLRRAVRGDDLTALNTLGSILGLLGEWEEARLVLERANAKDPQNTHVRRNLGWVYGHLGRFSEANSLLERAIVEQPNEPRIHEELGRLRLRAGRPAEAVHALSMAAALEPGNASVLSLLGIARAQVGEWGGAVRAFEAAVKLTPQSPLARENLNRARRRQPPLLPPAPRARARVPAPKNP